MTDPRWIVDVLASRYATRYPRFEREELRSIAHVGLVRAALDFDPRRQVAFRSHAFARVELSIKDAIRSERRRTGPRGLARAAEEALAEFSAGSLGPPSPFASAEEVASDYRDELFGALAAYMIGGASAPVDPETALSAREAHHRALSLLAKCRALLPERDQELLRLRYDEQMELADMQRARFPAIPYSTLTRYHRDALVRLGKLLRKYGLSVAPSSPDEG